MGGQALERSGPSVRYKEIEEWLRGRVLCGAPGDALPSELELASQFQVSRMTARQAVQNLAREGLVRPRRGSGTYIAPRPLHRHAGPLLNFSSDMRRRGRQPSSRLLSAELREGSTADVEALQLDPGSRVVSLTRLRLADDVPMCIESAALPVDCASILAHDLERGSLHEALTELGREAAVALTWISARTASAAQARLLDIPSRSALLVERRIILDTQERPLEHTESCYVADRYVIDAVFTVDGAARPSSSTSATQPGSLTDREAPPAAVPHRP